MQAGCTGEDTRLNKKTKIRINSLGLRGPEYGAKKKGELRVLLLGPSSLYGVGHPENETISSEVERRLTKKYRRNIRVINASVEGYYVLQHYLSLQNLLHSLKPDITMLVLSSTDGPVKDTIMASGCDFDTNGLPISCQRNLLKKFPRITHGRIEKNSDNYFKAYTASIFWDRLLLSWRLWLMRDYVSRTAYLMSPFIPVFKEMQKISEKNGSKFLLFEGQIMTNNRVYIGSYIDQKIANFFQFFTPYVLIGIRTVHNYLAKYDFDLHTFPKEIVDKRFMNPIWDILAEDNLHLSDKGIQEFAESISAALEKSINKSFSNGKFSP